MLISGGAPMLRYDVKQFATTEANVYHAQLIISSHNPTTQLHSVPQSRSQFANEMAASSAIAVPNAPEKEKGPTVKKKRKWTRVGTPPRECLVCGDGAYGYNYGAVTCESCKAFYRRHLNKADIQPCPSANNCEISKKTRKYCPACRLKKCIEAGMRPEVNPLRRSMVDKCESDAMSSCSVKQEFATVSASNQSLSSSSVTDGSFNVTSASSTPRCVESLAVSGRQLCSDEFNRIRKICNTLVLTMNEPFTQADLNQLYVADPSSPFELCGLGEVLLKRFVRFAKRIPEFCSDFTFDEKIVILKKSVFTCHIFNGVYSYDSAGRKVLLDDGRWKVIPRNCMFDLLKKQVGIVPNEADIALFTRWVDLNKSLREKFPACWQLITAALTMITLFSPDFYDRPTSSQPSSNGSSNGSGVNESDQQRNFSISTKIAPLHATYLLFLSDYIAQTLAEQGVTDTKQFCALRQYCLQQCHDARSMTNTLSERIGSIIALDPTSAINTMPLSYELRDH